MQIALYKTQSRNKCFRQKTVGSYWTVSLSILGLELEVRSAAMADDVSKLMAR